MSDKLLEAINLEPDPEIVGIMMDSLCRVSCSPIPMFPFQYLLYSRVPFTCFHSSTYCIVESHSHVSIPVLYSVEGPCEPCSGGGGVKKGKL